MKTIISYVSGLCGDFIVNCCNHSWELPPVGSNVASSISSTKNIEDNLNNKELIEKFNSIPYQYIGSHLIDRLLKLPVSVHWIVVPDKKKYKTFLARDAITRDTRFLMSEFGSHYDIIRGLVAQRQNVVAAEYYLNFLLEYNWVLMQMRLVQPITVDVTNLLTPVGIDELINQVPVLVPVSDQCRMYHALWLRNQPDFNNHEWVLDILGKKLCDFVEIHEKNN